MLFPQGIEPALKRRLLHTTPGGKLFVRFYALASLEFINQLLPEPSASSLSHARTLFERHSLGQDVQNRTVTGIGYPNPKFRPNLATVVRSHALPYRSCSMKCFSFLLPENTQISGEMPVDLGVRRPPNGPGNRSISFLRDHWVPGHNTTVRSHG